MLKPRKEIIKKESVEHLITVLYCMLEDPLTDTRYKEACSYVDYWVRYRLPRKYKK